MGLPVVRLGVDVCSGHQGPGQYSPRPAAAGALTVFVNGFPVVRVGDLWSLHTNQTDAHAGTGIAGSETVFCEGKAVMRMNDPIDCGSVAAAGSLDTFCG